MKILCPAKINLALKVTGKRPDGYHELVSLMCCVDLYDTLILEPGARRITIQCDHPGVPADESNLAYKAAALVLDALNTADGVGIVIEKRIPVAAGLGGGSSNAAAVLVGLNRYYGHPFSSEALAAMGLAIGADVPFFVFGKPAVATGIGEKLEAYAGLEKRLVLLIYPGFSVSTAEVYKNLNLGLTKCKKKLSYSLLKKGKFEAEKHLCNDLETVAESIYPEITTAKEALITHGAEGALMSGSGPTVFGLFSDIAKARKAKENLLRQHSWRLYLAEMLTQGVRDTG